MLFVVASSTIETPTCIIIEGPTKLQGLFAICALWESLFRSECLHLVCWPVTFVKQSCIYSLFYFPSAIVDCVWSKCGVKVLFLLCKDASISAL